MRMPMKTWATFSLSRRRSVVGLVEVRRRAGEGAALGAEEFLGQFVHGRVLLELLDQPVVVEEHALLTDLVRDGANLEQFGPLR